MGRDPRDHGPPSVARIASLKSVVTGGVQRERTREIGIRMALGASSPRVLRMIVARTLVLVGIGLAIGVLGAFGATRALTRYLFGVGPSDPATFAATALLLIGVALAAASVPAWRASHVDPVIALREE
jgi:ABC-type antimicrobial peptide transport system permease subunit